MGPTNNNSQTTQELNETNTVIKPNRNNEKQCSNKKIYQNIQKKQPREKKFWTIPFLLESPKIEEFH